MKNIFPVALLLFLSVNCFALERRDYTEISIPNITADIQAQPEAASDSHMTLVWWVPYEYWASVFSRDPNVTEPMRKQLLAVLKNYMLIAVVQADISPLGTFSYYSQDVVQKNLAVKYKDSKSEIKELSPSDNVSGDMSILLSQITPVLKAAMGNMGSNFHFFVYDDIDSKGERIADPYEEGTLSASLSNADEEQLSANFKTPLNSLFIPRKCPNGEDAHVSWKYCPWSGKKL